MHERDQYRRPVPHGRPSAEELKTYRTVPPPPKRRSWRQNFLRSSPNLLPFLLSRFGAMPRGFGESGGESGGGFGQNVAPVLPTLGAAVAPEFIGPEQAGSQGPRRESTADKIRKYGSLAGTVGGLIAMLKGGSGGGNQLSPELQHLLENILELEAGRFRETGPLHSAAMSGIYQFLPAFAQRGGLEGIGLGSRNGAPSTPLPPSGPSSGSSPQLPADARSPSRGPNARRRQLERPRF